jgi:hypothetical protein
MVAPEGFKQLNLQISMKMYDAIDESAKALGITKNEFVCYAIGMYLLKDRYDLQMPVRKPEASA